MRFNNKKKCACCGFYTISEIKETCPVCYWDEDSYQEMHINNSYGPNYVSLRMAKFNYKEFGAIEERFIRDVRLPLEKESAGEMSKGH